MAIQPQTTGVAHLALRVTDLRRSLDFYARLLGFPVAFEVEGLVGVMAGPTLLALRGPVEQTAPDDAFSPFRIGLDHVALGCADPGELSRVAQALTEAGVENTGVKHDELTDKDYVAFKGSRPHFVGAVPQLRRTSTIHRQQCVGGKDLCDR